MPQPLDARIAAALAPGARAVTVADLVSEVASLIETAQAERAAADRKATAFDTPEDEADAAADAVVKADRRIARLTAAKEQLEARHSELMTSERRKRQAAEHAAIKQRRDALVADLREAWPRIEGEIIGLLHRIKVSDAEIAAFQQGGSPAGLEWLESAEAIARDVPGNWASPAGPIRRLTQIILPTFDGKSTAWPDHRPYMERRVAIEAQQRAQLQAAAREREAAAARFKTYKITAPANAKNKHIDSAHGRVEIMRPGTIRMSEEQAAAARKRGFEVEMMGPEKTVGLPSGMPFLS